jgi:hypothetical protein
LSQSPCRNVTHSAFEFFPETIDPKPVGTHSKNFNESTQHVAVDRQTGKPRQAQTCGQCLPSGFDGLRIEVFDLKLYDTTLQQVILDYLLFYLPSQTEDQIFFHQRTPDLEKALGSNEQ